MRTAQFSLYYKAVQCAVILRMRITRAAAQLCPGRLGRQAGGGQLNLCAPGST